MKDFRLILFSRQAFMCRDIYMSAEKAEDLREEIWSMAIAEELLANDPEEYSSLDEALREVDEEEYYLICVVDADADLHWGNL